MSITKIDMFSSQFFFNFGNSQQIKKGTLIGALLTIAVIASIMTYFAYLTIQYFNNKIDPKYKSQNFITDDLVEVDLTSDLVGFRFEYDVNKNILDLEAQQNQKYVVFKAFFNYQNSTFASMTPIDIVNCTNPQLEGYLCIDFQKVSNFTLNLNTKSNYKTALYVLTQGCLDINGIQQTTESNCASQDQIDSIFNGEKATVRTKLLSAQFNTTSKQKQSSYRNNYMYTSADQAIYVQYKLQKQITTVQQGFLIQSTSTYESPFQYEQIYSTSLRNSSTIQGGIILPYCEFVISMDEIFYQITVQYPTYPEIMALVNSALAFLMTLGFVGRYLAQKLIKQEFFLLFLQNMYQDTYEQIMQINNLFQKNDAIYFQKMSLKKSVNEEFQVYQYSPKITVPYFRAKNNSLAKKFSYKITKENVFQTQINQKRESEQQNLQTEQEKIEQMNTIMNQNEKSSFFDKKMIDIQKFNSIDALQSPYSPTLQASPKQNFFDSIDESSYQLGYQQLINNLSKSGQNEKKIRLTIGQRKQQKCQNLKTDQVKKNSQSDSSQLKQEMIENLNKKEINSYYTKKLEVIQNQKVCKNIQDIIFGKRFCKKKKEQNGQQLDETSKKLIESQVEKSLDILQLYQDIIFLKKAVMVILSKDQLATIKLIGCSPYFLNKEINQKTKHLSQSSQMRKRNYFEEQFTISLSQDLQKKYITKFLEKCQNSNDLSEIDYRILSSVIRNKIN
ncbi:AMP-binding enzyme family protein (macronuclear) [Tetrahymena thermophila SB210]|uniref:AMP-binding enzyme family protein n=1 Tax=Tetrahymena thermophila (strain SB210) TaxID=312017 RepID=Q22UH5_TETTS|nr:AMP-binding enzyme family protein [Tetrahymena thermophila SB210]EAR88995.1 AMP-binding enzyme family protein [Tetrahymena thermophila SB210]|eukprot:XP_001009240.1 AMP-binding enzyme family protein [Tetrahymena thermophila SB210]